MKATTFPQQLHLVKQTMDIPQRSTLTCKDLKFSVKVPPTNSKNPFKRVEKEILRGIDLSFQSGTLTAVMGASGAGKTTLLNALCGRALGNVSGNVLCAKDSSKFSFIIQVYFFVLSLFTTPIQGRYHATNINTSSNHLLCN